MAIGESELTALGYLLSSNITIKEYDGEKDELNEYTIAIDGAKLDVSLFYSHHKQFNYGHY